MTMESRPPEGSGPDSDLVRSMALSSGALWEEILLRLNEVQQGQARLAQAVEGLGMIVCEALAVDPTLALSAMQMAAELPGVSERLALPSAFASAPNVAGRRADEPTAAPAPAVRPAPAPAARSAPAPASPTVPAAATRPAPIGSRSMNRINALFPPDVFAPAPPTAPHPTGRRIPTAPGVVSTPLAFYVGSPKAEDTPAPREAAGAGALRSGVREHQRSDADSPGNPAGPDVRPLAVDAVRAAEPDVAMAPTSAPLTTTPAAEADLLLGRVLGTAFLPASAPAGSTVHGPAAGPPLFTTPAPPPTSAPPAAGDVSPPRPPAPPVVDPLRNTEVMAPRDSAASMATEILAVSPETPPPASPPEEARTPSTLTPEMTFVARRSRRRLRMR